MSEALAELAKLAAELAPEVLAELVRLVEAAAHGSDAASLGKQAERFAVFTAYKRLYR